MLSPDTLRWEDAGETTLYQRRTGRHLVVSTIDSPSAALLARLKRLYFAGPPPEYSTLIPVQSRRVIGVEGGLWHPLPEIRTAGGHAYALHPLDPAEARFWKAINDSRTVAQVAAKAEVSESLALDLCARLTQVSVQAMQLRDRPPHPRDASLLRLLRPPRPRGDRPDHLSAEDGRTSLTKYHLGITDGNRHFDNVETTIAHAHGVPHPGLQGECFGERLRGALARQGIHGPRVLEIGCGDGELAQAWGAERDYLRLDLSPELLRVQSERVPESPGILADAIALPLRDGSVDLVISNEVIADLSAAPGGAADVRLRCERYGITPGARVNLGAWQMIEEIARVLAPGGAAYLSEFGSLDEEPTETEQLDHPEVSIHFGHLRQVARGLGLEATCLPLAELLDVDLSQRQLSRSSYEALRAWFRRHDLHLHARAWTPATLPLRWPVHGLRWVSLDTPGPGPLFARFQALILRKK